MLLLIIKKVKTSVVLGISYLQIKSKHNLKKDHKNMSILYKFELKKRTKYY